MPDEYHVNGASVDGTREFLAELANQESDLIYVPSNGFWNSKDDQVNRAMEEVKKLTDKCFLWEFDIDEQWTSEAMDQAEKELVDEKLKYAGFMSRYYVGKNLLASGEWGEEMVVTLDFGTGRGSPLLDTNHQHLRDVMISLVKC